MGEAKQSCVQARLHREEDYQELRTMRRCEYNPRYHSHSETHGLDKLYCSDLQHTNDSKWLHFVEEPCRQALARCSNRRWDTRG